MIAVAFPSWTDDAPCLLEAVGAVLDRGIPAQDCLVAHNPERPVPGRCLEILTAQGVAVVEHDYIMRKTVESTCRIAKTLRTWGRERRASHVLKVDSDTVIAKFDRIRKAVEDGVLAAGWTWPSNYLSGCCPLFSMEALEALTCRESYELLGGSVPGEDMAQHYVLTRLYGFDSIRHWWFDENEGFGKGWQYRLETRTLEDYARSFDVVTFGNRKRIPGGCRGGKREEVARTMAKFRNILRDNEKQSIRS